MKLFLSSVIEHSIDFDHVDKLENLIDFSKSYILQTYYKIKPGDEKYQEMAKDFLMDSGAFSVMNSKRQASTFNALEYTKKYATYIKERNIKSFIELDIDGVFGIKTYIDCLHCLQDITGLEPLRVWHKRRGFRYWDELTKKFDRVCIGGIAVKDISLDDEVLFNYLLSTAKKNNCKVHGLGVGSAKYLRKYDFDSVDSAGWLSSMQFGKLYKFDGHEVNWYKTDEINPEGERLARRFSGIYALKEWAEFSYYIDSF